MDEIEIHRLADLLRARDRLGFDLACLWWSPREEQSVALNDGLGASGSTFPLPTALVMAAVGDRLAEVEEALTAANVPLTPWSRIGFMWPTHIKRAIGLDGLADAGREP